MGTDIVRAGAIPPALAQAGVGIVQGDGGYLAVTIPEAVREKFNVLQAMDSVQVANPMFAPAISTVQLTKDHVYEQERGSFELRKGGLIALARAAGISVKDTRRMAPAELGENEIGYRAVIEARRADGTLEHVVATRILNLKAEWEKILAQGGGDEARARSRWAKEREHYDAKCETKAVLRAIRTLLQVPGKMTPAQFAKPFLVVKYTLAPDYTDPKVRDMAIAAAFGVGGAASQVYDAPPQVEPPAATRELPAARGPIDDDDEIPVVVDDETGEILGVAPEEFEDAFEGPEPDPPGRPAPVDDEPGHVIVDFGRHSGKTVREIYDEDAGYVRWLAKSASTPAIRQAASAYFTDD